MLQALFNKIWVDNEGVIGSEFTEIYKNIAGPIEKDIARRNGKSASDNSDADFPDRLLKSYSKFFEKGLNNELLVEMRGVEPLSEDSSEGFSPSAFRDLVSPVIPSAERLYAG